MFHFKQFSVEDSSSPMKVGTDGVLLGAWTPVENNAYTSILDIGTGCGVIALMLAQRINNANIQAIDIDSAYVAGADAPISKFLTHNTKLWNLEEKYPYVYDNIRQIAKNIPNKNTTILSYIYMLLNVLTGEYSPDMSTNEFCNVLNMLNTCGVKKELLDSIYNIYFPKDNYIDYLK